MIVGKEYIGRNRLFLDFFYHVHMYGRVVVTSCIEIRGYCRKYERFLWVKIYGILSLFTHELLIFWKITYLHTELQRKKLDLLHTHKGLAVLDLCQDSFFHRSKHL